MALTANQDWLYKKMSGMNVDLGSEEQFAQAMQDESNRQWVYEQAGKMGIDLGTPEQFASAMLPTDAVQTGVSGGSLLSEQEELARQNAIQGVTDDPYRPHVEQKQPNAFQTFYKGLGAGVINTANGLLGFLNRANSGRLAYDPVTLQQMAKQGKSPEEIEQAAQATRERLDNAETERYNAWKAKADQLATEAKPDGGEKSFTDYLNPQSDDFDLGKALQLGLGTAAESLPYTLSALNPVATASMIMSMSEQNYRQSLIDNPDMSDGQRLASAAGNAAIEMAVEHIGNPFKVFKAGKLTAPNATKWIKQVVKESKDNIYKGILRVLGFGAKEAGKEGLEEVITTAGQDLYNTLLDWKDTNGLGLQSQWERMKEQNPDITPEEFAMYKAEGLTNDFIGGALSGMMMSGPSTGVGVARAAKYYSKNGGSEESRAQAQQQLAVLQQLATEFDVTEEEVAQAIVDYQAQKQLTPKQQALINRGEEIVTNLQNAQSATQATEPQETTPLSPTAAEYARVVNEVTQSVRERTHGNGYIYPVAMPGNAEKTGFIVGEVVPVIDESDQEQLRIENDDIVTVKWSDGTVTQERARDLDLTGAPMMAQQAVDIEVELQMYGYTQQRIQNGEQPVLMRNGEGILEGFFQTEGGLLEDQNGVQYTPEQLAEQGWQETKPVLFVNDTQQIAALDNGDGTYTQVDALGNPIAEPMSAEAFREQGFAMVPLEEEQPKSQAPVEAPSAPQAPEVQEPAAPVVPNIETMSAADYAGAAVEYMGSREYVDEYLDGEIKKVQQQLDVANRKKVGNVTDMADFKAKKDAIEAEKKALQGRLDKLTEAREKAKSYLTIAEREARAKAEAERRAAEEAARIAREQAAAAEAARLEQERIDRELKKGVPDFSEDNDRDARARGFHVLNGQVIRRQTPLTPIAVGKPVMVQFAKGKNGEAEAVNVLININELQPSHINGQRNPAFFVSEMQPKDRRDQVSKVTAQEAAQNIHPGEIIGGTTAYVGSPVVLSTGEVVQGNWRGNVLIEMYRNYPESVAKYKQALIDNAASLNLTEQDIERIKNEDVISVRMLKDLPIEQAIQLGQKKATDLETGGVQLIDPQVTATQLGDKIERFANTLLKSDDEEASLADLTLRNGKPALDFLQSLNIISPAQMQSAFDSRGNMTAETKAALQGVLKQVLFKDAKNDNLPIMFDDIPLTAQKAILQTIVRDIKTTNPEAKLTPHIQDAIGALYRALHQSAEVKNGRNEQEIRAAMRSWALQMQFPSDFDAENFVPSEIFSNFALELATLFKYGKQTEIAKKLNAYYDAVQGTTGGLFGDTPAIPYKEAIKQIFGIDYKSVDEVLREKHRKELTDYLNTIADEAHPFELYGNDNVIEILKGLGANDVILARAQELIDSGESILGIKGNGGRLLLNSDSLADKEAARSKYVHERQHLLTTPEQKERVLKAASVDELKLIVKIFTNGSDFYDRAGEDEIADEFISYSMEEAYAVESDEELESILRAAGANDELINIIKSINNEQRENDERLGQSERLGNARRHTDVDTNSEGHREQGGRDQGTESGVLEPKGARLDTRGELGGRTGGEDRGSTEGAGLSEVGSEEVSGEEAGGAGDNAGIAGENQGSSGVGQERGLGEVTATPAEDNAHLSDNESAFVAPQMPIDTQTNAQKQSKAPSEEEQQQAAQYLNEALQEVISKSGDKLPQNITIDENTIEDNPDSVEMTARLLIDGKPSDFSVTIFDQSLGARGGFDPVNMVKFYPREELDKWDWDLADRLAEEFNKTRTQESGLATVMDESDAVYFFNMQAALDFAEKARQEITPSDDPRFAISGTQVIPVGEKTLVGLHNISAEKLRKAIKMGGLANPSTAVINIASQNHEQYGDISLIMPSSLVDSKTGRNAGTFTGDIWSPTYPHVEKQMSDKGDEAYYQAITKAFGDNEARRPILSRAKLDFDDYLDSGNVRAGLAYWYLLEKGIEPGDVYFNSGISDDIKERFRPLYDKGILDLTKEDYRTLLSLIAEQQGKTAEDMLQDAQESKARYQQTIDDPEAKQFYKKIAQQAIDEIDLYGVRYNVLSNGYHAMERAVRDDGKIDLTSTLIAAQDIVQTQHQADFDKWLSDMDKRFDIKEVLFEDYDRDGNRIYKPHTLANASRMMNKEDLQNAGDHSGLGATRGQLVERMETLADIRANKGRLRPGAEEDFETEEWNKMQDEWFNKVLNPLSEMQKISDNPFSQVGYAETRLQEALRTKDPIATLNKEYGYKIDPNGEWAKNLRDMVQRVKDLPTKYFETKFRRPVYLNEFANAVVPNDLPQDLRAGLESAGLRLFSYDPNTQGSRRDATLKATEADGIRFSINGNHRSSRGTMTGHNGMQSPVFADIKDQYLREMADIKDKAIKDGTFMQAPNGKPSRLNERQWLQVRTRAFKRWFGDWQNDPQNASKILDENGEPRVVFHGRSPIATFTEFRPSPFGSLGVGIYFAPDRSSAEAYSRRYGGEYGKENVIEAFLNMRNPLYSKGQFLSDAERAELDKHDGVIFQYYGDIIEINAHNPNQIKSATNNDGSFSEENDDIRFSISNQNNDIFYSNAERAVEGIKQEKATPEQWRAMIEKAGGLKAGEDKWIGLSDWLAQQRPTVTPQANETRSQFVERAAAENKRFTLSKQDLLDYIREHKIQIEETHYQEEVLNGRDVLNLRDEIYDRAYDLMSDARERYYDIDNEEESMQEAYEDAMGELKADYGEDVEYYYNIEISGYSFSIVRTGTDRDFYEFALNYYHDANDEEDTDTDKEYSPINSTRLRYSTEGLENKREIALTVPTIDSWGRGDDIHFGDAGEGRAIAWVRFGDATDEQGNKILVIDEIQSKRHQEGREKGYADKSIEDKYRELNNRATRLDQEFNKFRNEKDKEYGYDLWYLAGDEDAIAKYGSKSFDFSKVKSEDVVKFNELNKARHEADREEEQYRPIAAQNAHKVDAAPFEKNWHELAMKRILRFAAENGYDKVAWTTGDQQAARYNIGNHVDGIDANPFMAGVTPDIDYDGTQILIYTDGATLEMDVDKDGNVVKGYESASMEYEGKNISDIVGKEIARKLLTGEEVKLRGEDFRIGGEGMRGFYDDILPRFMQKYGKKWGVQVGEVTMPQLEDGYQTMHAIDINDAMRESVLEGQPMFSISGRGVNGTMKPQEGETRSQYIARVAETVKNMTPRNTTIDDAIRFSITVNHNSPYLLKRADGSFVDPETGERLGFDLRFIGKGEGNQAHGWGSYFSVNDLRKYAKNAHSILYKGEDWRNFEDNIIRNALGWVYTVVDNNRRIGHNLTKDNLLRALKQEETRLAGYTDPAIVRHLKNLQNAEEWVKENLDDISIDNRHHYTVSIPDNDGTNYIEERQPMNARARKAIMDGLIADGYTMEEKDNGEFGWYEFNKGDFREDPDNQISLLKEDETYGDFIHDNFHGYDSKMLPKISEYLSKAGIVGIHYDGRRDGECYVIFNPDDAVITDHIRFSVTGSRGAANIDKMEGVTIRMDNLAAARQMEEDGKDAKTIRMATGWERGADGKWRYEIDDVQLNADNVKANFRKLDRRGVTAPMVWYHNKFTDIIADSPERKQLLAAYPQLADLDIEFYDYPNKERGAYSSEKKKISVNRANVRSVDECRSVLLHEIQHAIQEAELFAKGTSKEQIQLTWKLNNEVHNKVDEYFDKMGFKEWLTSHNGDKAFVDRLMQVIHMFPNRDFNIHYLFVETLPRDKQIDAIDVLGDANDVIQSNRDAIYGADRKGMTMKPDELYHNAAGEVESRNVQNRMNLTPEERRERLLAETEDVAREDQVVIMNAFDMANDDATPRSTMDVQPGENKVQYAARIAEEIKRENPKDTSLDEAIRFSITVNHNSPYLLKRADGAFVDPETGERLGFDLRFIGKGEGGQAHGWGSYFSVNDIRSYGEGYGFSLRDIKDAFNTSRWQSFGVGDAFDVAKGYLLEAHSEKAPSLRKWLEDRLAQKQELLKNYEGKVANTAEENLMVFRAEADVQYIPALLRDMVNDIDTRNRHHYDVEIPDNDGTNYFEEDQPLTQEQIDRLRKAAKETGIPKFLETISGFLRFAETNPEEYPFRKFYSDITDFQYGYPRETISNFLKDAGFVGIHYDGHRDGECYVIFNPDDAVITDHIRFSVTGAQNEDEQIRFSVVTSRKKIAELEAGEKIKVYRAAQVIDGKLYPPMAAKQQGQLVKPIELGRWEQAEEHPELAKDGKFKLDKANGSSVVPAAYNPYFHTSRSPLNDQFSSAYDRPNLVTLEVEVPASELTSGYKAEGAKDAVGETNWHSGAVSGKLAKVGEPRKVILSRWDKPLRIVPDAEVAEKIAGMLAGKDIAIPYNVVTPSLRAELEKQGVTISDQPSGTVKKPKEEIRFSVNNPSTLSRSETVTKALVQQANNNYNIMQSALKKVTADLKGIRAAMRMQSDYDRKVVDSLLNLYNTLLQENGVWAQYMPDTTRRIATQIVHAIGKQNITEEVNTIMDHMVNAQAKAAQRQWDKLRHTPIDKINISGVVMQGKVALEGQHALKAMNDALQANMTIEQIEEQINQLMDMEDNATDESLKTQYKGQWIGLTIAAQHLERLQHLQEERQQLDLELQSARSNKALKPAARQQLVENIKQAMRDNYIEQAEAYTRSTQDLSEYVNTQEGRAKDFIRRQDANRDKIRSYAQRDLEGLATNPNRNRTRGNVARSIWDAFASPIRDLQSLLRLTGMHAPDGEGYLYNHFMRNWMDGADKERTGIVAASKTLDEKIAELTHGKYKTWEEAARKINDASHNMFGITMLNGVDGKDMPVTEEIPLNAGNALYIYAVNKMNDGRMKLNGMNITEEDVQALADKVREQFGQEILDVVDWVQSEFFSQLRNRYNPTHEALFGAPMDAIENYFPLRINANARQQNEDLSEPDTDAARLLAGTSTGAIKRRTRNSLPLDVRNADFFQEVIRHISQMERWNAFAQWNRDANILFSDINFRNRIKGMKGTIYGEGDKLYNYMKDAFRVAIGTYKPNADGFSKEILNAAKGVTSAKINFRIFTALKQIASFPAFFTYMQDGVFVGSYLRNWLKPHETMKWAKENLPNFEKRVSKRDMGDMRLMQRSTDWQWNKRILEWSSKYGMFFNVFFDTLTCATGARAVYDSHLADYMKKGYSEEDARNRARQDAEQAFNTSQQSSEGAFMAPIQMDRNAVTAALTVFRTSPMQYTRNFFFHVRGLLRKIGDGKREEQIAFRMGQYKNDGLNDEQARKAAEKDYNKSIRADVTGVVVYGALLGILWRLVGSFPYLFFGDDDDKKKQIVMDAVTGGAFVQPITGLIGGSYIESALDGNGLISSMFAPELPFTQDAKRAEQYLQNNKYAEFASQALSVLMQSGTGFDPLTASDMVSRIVTTLDSEEELDAATQALRVSQALLSIPQSQYEQMLIDKVVSGKTDEDAALEDYIRYQKIHTAPLTWWLRGEESDEKAEENAEKRFNKLLTERDKIKNPEDYEE